MASVSTQGNDERARLIREMSRDLNRSRSRLSGASIAGSHRGSEHGGDTGSTFNPEDDALMSTRRIDDTKNSFDLPQLRSSAQKYKPSYAARAAPPPEDDYRINTSVLARAFPEFSDATPSDEDSMSSIELGRAGKQGTRRSSGRFSLSPIAHIDMGDDSIYNVMATPPARPQNTKKANGAEQGTLRKEAQLRSASTLKKDGEAAEATDTQKSNAGRPRLSEMHARVSNEESAIEEERPTTVTFQTKNTRFALAKARQRSPVAARTPPQHQNETTKSATLTAQQSFMLPDLPDIAELVSGLYRDGTPVFSQWTPSRSRFASGTLHRSGTRGEHVPVGSVPMPMEEKAIFASLQLLKEKVEKLEQEKSAAEIKIDEYEHEVLSLKSDLEAQRALRRTDSGFGSEDERSKNEWRTEKARLEASVSSLQARLDAANRKTSVTEITFKRLTQERDNVVTQLGVAYYNSEELKTDNEILRKENEELRAQFRLVQGEQEEVTNRWTQNEIQLQARIARLNEANERMKEATQQIWAMRAENPDRAHLSKKERATKAGADSKRGRETRKKSPGEIGNETKARIATDVQDELQKAESAVQKLRPASSRQRSKSRPQAAEAGQSPRRPSAGRKMVVVESPAAKDGDESTTDIATPAVAKRRTGTFIVPAEELTYTSFMQGDEIAKLRRALELEKAAHRRALSQIEQQEKDITRNNTRLVSGQREEEHTRPTHAAETRLLPRKSSMRELSSQKTTTDTAHYEESEPTGRFSVPSNMQMDGAQEDDDVQEDKENTAPNEPSIMSNSSRRRRNATVETTSAFILPDITMSHIVSGDKAEQPAEHVMDNFTACTPEPPVSANAAMAEVKVPPPVPVSTRMPQPTAENPDPTIRPSTAPSQALALVIKSLTDELTQLRISLAGEQTKYAQHDPSLSASLRKRVKSEIDRLGAECEKKSDMIYALYDAAEAHKAEYVRGTREEEVAKTAVSVRQAVDEGRVTMRGGDGRMEEKRCVFIMESGRDAGADAEGSDGESEEEEEEEEEDDSLANLPYEGVGESAKL